MAIRDSMAVAEPGLEFVCKASEELELSKGPVVAFVFEVFFAERSGWGKAEDEFD